MIARERNTLDLKMTLFGRLLKAGSRVNRITAVMIGMRWERWAQRVGLWGTERHQRRQASVEDYAIDLWAGPTR